MEKFIGNLFNSLSIRLNALCLVRLMFMLLTPLVIPDLIGNPLLIIPIYIFYIKEMDSRIRGNDKGSGDDRGRIVCHSHPRSGRG